MKKSGYFWGTVIVVAGVLLLLRNLGIFNFNFWALFWPVMLVLLGVWLVLGPVLFRNETPELQQAAVALQGASSASVRVHHGAGRLRISAGDHPAQVVSGEFYGGLRHSERLSGSELQVDMHTPDVTSFGFPWAFNTRGLDWTFTLNRDVPLRLKLETGASENVIDLRDLRVSEVELSTGASSTDITLPANAGLTRFKVESGAASVIVRVPEGVAGHIKVSSGLASIKVAPRFARLNDIYESADFATATNRVEISVETGVASVEII